LKKSWKVTVIDLVINDFCTVICTITMIF
jgi:hypothetical protein